MNSELFLNRRLLSNKGLPKGTGRNQKTHLDTNIKTFINEGYDRNDRDLNGYHAHYRVFWKLLPFDGSECV